MTIITRELLSKKTFNDIRNYPYGFSRSGDFSIRESEALMRHGALIMALVTGELAPTNAEEQSLLQVAKGEKAPETLVEKTWVKYQTRINRPKVASMYGRTRYADEAFDSGSVDDDIVIDD
ncbi:hypothetical protein CWI84_11430 [Idiomarina tyrosinivorans]|uniref:Macrodomain Ori protein n=1 Tax=Idiomarina tyrosinivorans TaxID=1445662 RepID=A0A432ZFA3_9GAMM|nr:DUF413 domain-containing protein [Idiomarina tyrosinivorans]RUO76601.1 hypothetical protein CWI84_11430 [Idiomarina tyrosinivorans]